MLLALTFGLLIGTGPAQVGVLDLDGRRIDPLQVQAGLRAVVHVFTSIECPISNRYAPDLRRLYEMFAPAGVRFWLVFPNPADRPDAIRHHIEVFNYPVAGRSEGRRLPMGVLTDPERELVRFTKATVTPEAAVFDRRGVMVYRGRIDDRYADLGVDRLTPRTRDLEDAITATLAGRRVPNPITPAVGCFITDFTQ